MRLLYLTNTRFPCERAHATQIAHMCQAFSENGISLTLIANDRSIPGQKTFQEYFGFEPLFTIYNQRFGLIFVNQKLFFILNNFFYTLFTFIKHKLKTYDVFYVRDEWLGLFLLLFVPAQKIIYESHEAKYNFSTKLFFKRGVRCVCISEGIYESYASYGVSKTQMIVAHDGIDSSFFEGGMSKDEVRRRLGLPNDAIIAMYIGGFDSWKGVETFMDASKYAPGILFVAIGGTEIQRHSFADKYPAVRFLGQLPYKDLKDNQRAADVLVIPNTAKNPLSSTYTSPLKLFAHMASRVPLVVSHISSLNAVLNEGEAYWFTPDDPHSLAESVMIVAENPVRAEECAEKAYIKSKQYTWQNRAAVIHKFIL